MANNTSTITWQLIENLSDLEKQLSHWRKLASQTHANLFCCPDWIMTWIKIYWQPSWQLKTIVGFKNNQLIAIVPLYLQPKKRFFSRALLQPIGQGEPEESEVMSEYQDITIKYGYNNTAIHTEIAKQIQQLPYIQLTCRAALKNSNWSHVLKLFKYHEHTYVGKRYLLHKNESYLQSLSKNNKSKWQRAKNKLDKLSAEFIWISQEAYNEFWINLIDMHQQRWKAKGKLGAFFHSDFIHFHNLLQQKDATKMSALLINGAPVAINYYLHDEATLYFYQSGWNEKEYASLSPGFCLHIWSIQNNPLKEYDFMMGEMNDSYKSAFQCNIVEEMCNINTYKNSLLNFIFASKKRNK